MAQEKEDAFEMEKLEKRLIKRVDEHDLLYKIDHIHYRDKQMRAAAWKDIAEDLGIPGNKVFVNGSSFFVLPFLIYFTCCLSLYT